MPRTFSPKQVVAIAASVAAVAVFAPVAVEAAAPTQVQIIDAYAATSKTRVNAVGGLWTTPVDPVTKAQAKVSADGRLNVGDGTGALTVDMAAPQTPWNQINDLTATAGASRNVLFTAVGPTKLNLTSFTLAAEGASAGTVRLFVIVYVSDTSAGNCVTLTGASFGAAERFIVTVPVGQTINLNYPTPLVLSAYASSGRRYCVDFEASGPTGYTAHVSASGFLS